MAKKEFRDSLNTAVFTTKDILDRLQSILYVYHHEEDGAWEFSGEKNTKKENYVICSLEEIIERDPSILEISSIRLGYYASRIDDKSEWKINKI